MTSFVLPERAVAAALLGGSKPCPKYKEQRVRENETKALELLQNKYSIKQNRLSKKMDAILPYFIIPLLHRDYIMPLILVLSR